MTGLVIFLHGLRGDRSHWADVPTYVGSALSSFTTVSLEYSAEARSVADIQRSASQVLTKIQNVYTDRDPIFLVGFSMGGLVAREVCLKLLLANDDSTKLLQRIAGVVTFGTPLCGMRRGWRASVVNAVKRHLTPKVGQLGIDFAFGRYKEGIESAAKKGIDGPKHFHFEIENDEIVASDDVRAYTKDDFPAGTIGGTHGEFLATNQAQNEVADLLLAKIEEVYNALGRSNKPRPSPTTQYDLADRILLIACSNRKKSGGSTGFGGPEPVGWLPQPELKDQIKSRRAAVLSILKASKLVNAFAKSGNRIHQGPNRELKRGGDFGGVELGGVYLPAWQRYDGRCYTPIAEQSWLGHFKKSGQLSVLVMSGLYGWLAAAEWIQDYDVHLTDSNKDTGVTVGAMWSQLFTETLIAYINSAYKDRKVKVFNFLCDRDYVDAIQWHKLPNTCSVYHLASPDCEDTNLLPVAGTMIDFLLRCPDGLDQVTRSTRDSWMPYPLSDFGMPTDGHAETKVIFEATFGEAKKNVHHPRP